jgi:hypothetical protein
MTPNSMFPERPDATSMRAAVERYLAQGYLRIPHVFPLAALRGLRQEVERIVAASPNVAGAEVGKKRYMVPVPFSTTAAVLPRV